MEPVTGRNCIQMSFTISGQQMLLLLQAALQHLLVMACSTIVEYSQQEGFYRVLLPAARQTSNLEDVPTPAIRCLSRLKRRERTPAAEGGNIAENFAESGDFHVTFGFFYMP